ncbi:heterokaryon incompatibility protein-domain-containing protein [Amylocarpus encephaloides]|uniref:Heterokaryon incompatibility protein-domain-containing protein n=1 Tax=Amylocarpus encephaloides TaxID=45428 RepID=A0A9P7Y7C9_9HELO|nr:heterokaryon incompatibility protein-domain-containing protein [Amylocarpus encephaloides]
MLEFCQDCKNIIDALFIRSKYKSDQHDGCARLTQRFPILNSTRDVLSLPHTCSLCNLMKGAVVSALRKDESGEPMLQDLESTMGSLPLLLTAKGGNSFRALSKDGGLQLRNIMISASFEDNTGQSRSMLSANLSVFAENGSPAALAEDVLAVGPIHDSSSPEALSMLQGWLTECTMNHDECKPDGPRKLEMAAEPQLPTRIIDVGMELGGAIVRLIESHGKRGLYAALSHCWGPPTKQPLRTVEATLSEHLVGISMSELPKTFRDSVEITRAVKLRYLWIDSLCIVQDNKADWSQEAPRMGPLYNSASLVIAASGATDSSQGCFLQRKPPNHALKIPYIREDGMQAGDITLVDDGIKYSPIFHPLGKRAWVFQEWMLANRIVHYTTEGMMWSCTRLNGASMFEDGSHEVQSRQDRQKWDRMIEEFTVRDITFLSDKLIAIQSLANEMQKSRSDQYIKGIWTGDLSLQLFWIGSRTTRPKELQEFPSWTWASTHGRCLSWSVRGIPLESIYTHCEIKNEQELLLTCRARDCTIQEWSPLVHDMLRNPPFGPYSQNSSLCVKDLPIHFYQVMVYLILDRDTKETVGVALLDDGNDLNDLSICTNAFLAYETGTTATINRTAYLSLLLKPCSRSPQQFRRIGVGFIVIKEWFEESSIQSFRVV